MSADSHTRLQFYVAAVASPTEPRTTLIQIQRVRTVDEDSWFSFPAANMSTASHPELMEQPAMKLAVKSLKNRGQFRNVTVGLEDDVLKLYNDDDGNFIFGDYMLPETGFNRTLMVNLRLVNWYNQFPHSRAEKNR